MLTCTKKAVIRRPGYPVGQPAPCFIRCLCGQEVDLPTAASDWFVVELRRPGHGWLPQSERATLDEAIADAKGWYPE